MKLTHAQLEQFHNIFSVNNLQCFGSRIQNGGWAERERERPCASAVPHMLVFSCLSYFYKWLSWRVHKLLLSIISPEQTDGVREKLWGPRVSREAPWLPGLMFVPNNDMSRKSNRDFPSFYSVLHPLEWSGPAPPVGVEGLQCSAGNLL